MRIVRAAAPAVLAGLLWLASGGLEWLGRRLLTGPERYLLGLVAPETVPVGLLTAPSPWGLVVPGLSAVAVAGAYAAFLGLVRRRRGEPGGISDFAAYWFCAVLAGTVVAAVPVVVDIVVALRDQAMPTGFAAEHLVAVAHWGLVWGWLPALLARALDRTTSGAGETVRAGEPTSPPPAIPPAAPPAAAPRATQPGSRAATSLVAAGVFLVAAAGLVVAVPAADAARVAALPTAASRDPEPAPTGTPVPPVAPGEWQIDPLWCTSGQLEITAGQVDPALGSRLMPITATNVSDAPCVLESYPDLAFSDSTTSALDVRVDHGGAMGTTDPGVTRFEIPPGGHAVAVLGWRAMSTSLAEPAAWLHVAAYHGAERQMLPVDTDITGGAVSVTAWGPAQE